MSNPASPIVIAVATSPAHGIGKAVREVITLRTGLGVEGDAHAGATVQHLSRMKRDPDAPNLRQIHLIHRELLEELRDLGFDLAPGMLGENILTAGLDLLDLPAGTRLRLGASAIVELTGLRNPCAQLDGIQPGLKAATLESTDDGQLIRKAGVMGIVIADGEVRAGDAIVVELPQAPHRVLEPV